MSIAGASSNCRRFWCWPRHAPTVSATPRRKAIIVQVLDDKTLAIPDRPGNNRLDSMENLLENPSVGLIFFIPGVDETLRINGTAEIRDDSDLVSRFENEGKTPKTVLVIKVAEAYLHCAKALMRSEIVVAGFASRGTAAAQLRSNDQGPDRRQGTGGKPRRHGPALPKNPLLTKKPGPRPGFWILLSASVSDGNAASR